MPPQQLWSLRLFADQLLILMHHQAREAPTPPKVTNNPIHDILQHGFKWSVDADIDNLDELSSPARNKGRSNGVLG